MLNKDICKNCINTETRYIPVVWNISDEKRWDEGHIFCPVNIFIHDVKAKTDEKPPPWCKFILEHIIY